MPHSNFKERSHTSNTSEKDMKMKVHLHSKFCSNPPKGFNKIRVPIKAMKLKEHQNNEAERMRKVHE